MQRFTHKISQFESIPPIADLIGNTPLIDLNYPSRSVSIFAKAEWLNPGGSVKDRAAYSMIKEGLESGELYEGRRVLEASSGNTAIALAMLGAAYQIPVTVCIPSNASSQRLAIIKAYGAELVLTDPLEGTDGAIEEARKLKEANPDLYFYTDQYSNEANWKAHYETTAQEILQQTNYGITHFIAGLGTSGTFTGTARRLRSELGLSVKLISVQPSSAFHGLEGLKHMESALIPPIYEPDLVDHNLFISTDDALEAMKTLSSKGFFVGTSSGAAYAATMQIAESIDQGVIVTIFPDRGERYLG